jgi:hypothetical protein
MQDGGKLFSTPLPADKAVSLPDPYNMTFPLPAPTVKEQPTVVLPTTTLKMIPGVSAGDPVPSVARLIGAPWHIKGDFHGGSGASLAYAKSEKDSFYKLPILKTLGAMFVTGNMTLKFTDMVVLDDMRKK